MLPCCLAALLPCCLAAFPQPDLGDARSRLKALGALLLARRDQASTRRSPRGQADGREVGHAEAAHASVSSKARNEEIERRADQRGHTARNLAKGQRHGYLNRATGVASMLRMAHGSFVMSHRHRGFAPMWSMVGTQFRVLPKTSIGARPGATCSEQAVLDVPIALPQWEFNALRIEVLIFTNTSRP